MAIYEFGESIGGVGSVGGFSFQIDGDEGFRKGFLEEMLPELNPGG